MRTECPHCKTSLIGESIPEHNRPFFGGKTHFNRAIAFVDRAQDRMTHWICPDCEGTWPVERKLSGD